MAVQRKRLTAKAVAAASKPGRHADGGNLYLNVTASGARSWVFMYRWTGRQREMGLGSVHDVTLAAARDLADAARRELREGRDPLALKRRGELTQTFGAAADAYIEAMRPQWKNEKHADQWVMTLRDYAAPIRAKAIGEIETADVLSVLQPIWSAKPETASRVRGRIESVLDAAKAKGQRTGENPARWRGHLDQLLPKRTKLSSSHHAAMPIDDLPAFMARIRGRDGISARALEFTILTAARTGEAIGARWAEVDFTKGLWTVPAERMKAGREHRVPLSGAALAVLEPLREAGQGELIFPGAKGIKPISNMSMDKVLRLEKLDVTVHGFRSTFRDWAAERTAFAHELSEVALAHIVKDKTEAAYRRGDMMEKRRALMEAWAAFCGSALTVELPHVV
jgi:integrase